MIINSSDNSYVDNLSYPENGFDKSSEIAKFRYCPICKKKFKTESTMIQHLNSKLHIKNEKFGGKDKSKPEKKPAGWIPAHDNYKNGPDITHVESVEDEANMKEIPTTVMLNELTFDELKNWTIENGFDEENFKNTISREELLDRIEEMIFVREEKQQEDNKLQIAQAIVNVITKKGDKKNQRSYRINKLSNSEKAVLAEKQKRCLLVNGIEYGERKENVTKLNRAGDNLQKNKLTGSRSSFVKSNLKP